MSMVVQAVVCFFVPSERVFRDLADAIVEQAAGRLIVSASVASASKPDGWPGVLVTLVLNVNDEAGGG